LKERRKGFERARLQGAPLDATKICGFSRRGTVVRPTREHATNNGQTYMVTSSTWGRRALFCREEWAKLLIDTLYHYRESAYLLHEFVIMPDHVHVMVTPQTSLEKTVQFIKGGFSFRVKKELGSNLEIWQKGFSDHRIRDASDYRLHQVYVRQNPVRKNLCERAEEYPYSSATFGVELDPAPQGLKPAVSEEPDAARLKGVPFQNKNFNRKSETGAMQSKMSGVAPQSVPVQSKIESRRIASAANRAKSKSA